MFLKQPIYVEKTRADLSDFGHVQLLCEIMRYREAESWQAGISVPVPTLHRWRCKEGSVASNCLDLSFSPQGSQSPAKTHDSALHPNSLVNM